MNIQEKNNLIIEELEQLFNTRIDQTTPIENTFVFNNVSDLKVMQGFDEIIKKEIHYYASRKILDLEILGQLLVSMAIDNEGGLVASYIVNTFSGEQLLDFIFIGLSHPWKEVRWQIMEIIERSEITSKESLLYYALKNEGQPYVLRVGLKILSELNKTLTKLIADKHLESKDPYLRVLSREITEHR